MKRKTATAQKSKGKPLTVVVGYDRATRLFVGVVPGLASANIAAETMEEVEAGLKKVVAVYRQQAKGGGRPLPDYIGIKKIELKMKN